MTYNLLFASLNAGEKDAPIRYYGCSDGTKRRYADAVFSAEATVKYFLSTVHINEIMVLGPADTCQEDENKKLYQIEDGRSFFQSDPKTLSAFQLFRCRLAQFLDGIHDDSLAEADGLSQEEMTEAEAFVRAFYAEHSEDPEQRKFSRFFDRLANDSALFDELKDRLPEAIPAAKEKKTFYMNWLKDFLYRNLRDSGRLEILEENETAAIRLVPSSADGFADLPVRSFLETGKTMSSSIAESIHIYVALDSNDISNSLLMIGVMDIIDMFSGSVEITQICTVTNADYRLAGRIRDNSDVYRMSELVSATDTFLRYGKADQIVDCWERTASKNEQVDKMVYAMRRIDTGLSLCSVGEIVRGISDLRKLFQNGFDLSACDPASKLFILMSEGIREDYGRLVTASDAGFIDVVRWANSKGFYQQCLTLIEAKAPQDMVFRGMFYYCNDEKDKAHVTELFARKRNMLPRQQYYLMEDPDHFFYKNYFRFPNPPRTIEQQRGNAKALLSCLENSDPDSLTGYTVCDDRQILEDLLFAYLHISKVRNTTNHAENDEGTSESLFSHDRDLSEKLVEITESIDYFIQCYDKVYKACEGKNPTVIRVTCDEVISSARFLEKRERREAREKDEKPSGNR